MARKKLVSFTRHYLAPKTRQLQVALDPEKVTKVIDCGNFRTLHYAAKDVNHVCESYNECMDLINAVRI